jgi:hypothetical protein
MPIAGWFWLSGPSIDAPFIFLVLLMVAVHVGLRLLTACRIYIDDVGLEVRYTVVGRNRIDWRDVVKAEKRGDTVYLRAGERRLTIVSAEYWRGADKQQFLQCLRDALVSRGVELDASVEAMLAYTRAR